MDLLGPNEKGLTPLDQWSLFEGRLPPLNQIPPHTTPLTKIVPEILALYALQLFCWALQQRYIAHAQAFDFNMVSESEATYEILGIIFFPSICKISLNKLRFSNIFSLHKLNTQASRFLSFQHPPNKVVPLTNWTYITISLNISLYIIKQT